MLACPVGSLDRLRASLCFVEGYRIAKVWGSKRTALDGIRGVIIGVRSGRKRRRGEEEDEEGDEEGVKRRRDVEEVIKGLT